MLAWMNREAYEETLRTGRACYFSRSRNRLWRKGEESGNVQEVREVFIDCDADTILLKVHQIGGAACHEGYRQLLLPPRGRRRLRRSSANASSIRSRCTRNERHRSSNSASPPAACRRRPASCFARPATRSPSPAAATIPTIDDPEIHCTLIRAQEMPRYVAGRLARLRPDRPRLDPGERRAGSWSWPSWSSAR